MIRGNILIINSSQLFREGLKHLLLKARFTVSGDGRNFAEAMMNAALSKPPDLIILTLEPGNATESSLAQIGLIRRDYPSLKLVALAPSLSSSELLQAMRAGVDAVLTHNISSSVLRASIELVLQSQQVFLAPMGRLLAETTPNSVVETVLGDLGAGQQDEKRAADETSNLVPFAPLRPVGTTVGASLVTVRLPPVPAILAEHSAAQVFSEREREILRHLVRGLSNKAMARELGVAETTVKVHVKGLMRKVRAANRTQVAIWAINHYFTVEEMLAQSAGSTVGLERRAGVRPSAVVGSSDQSRSA